MSPWTPYPALLAGVGEGAPGIHLSSGDKSLNGADVTVRLRMLKLQLSVGAQASDPNERRFLAVVDFKLKLVPQRRTIGGSWNEFVEEEI